MMLMNQSMLKPGQRVSPHTFTTSIIRSRPHKCTNIRPLHASNNNTDNATESFNLLESFFVGRAFAETLNERLGNLLGDVAVDIGVVEAEFRRRLRDFEDEVMARARREMLESTGATSLPSTTTSTRGASNNQSTSTIAVEPADLGEAVDNLRAEVAAARVIVQQIKQQKNNSSSSSTR